MVEREYEPVLLFMGIMSTRGLPETMKERLEGRFGRISWISPSLPFDFTDYYVPEMGNGIERFFISFERLISPDELSSAKTFTNALELEYAEEGMRKINLDPGTISEGNIILATTKNRAHRIAIGQHLYAEVTLMYHHKGFEAFPWTYADYRSEKVQEFLIKMRKDYFSLLRKMKEN